MSSRFAETLHSLQQQGRLRELRPLQPAGTGAFVRYQGDTLLNLTSNDYLGIGRNDLLRDQFYQQYETDKKQYGLAASSSRLLTGDTHLAHDLEDDLRRAYGSEAVLLFNSGYHANIGILPALCGKNDLILSDKLNHASIHDGLRLCRADHKRFRHRDYEQLADLLARFREDYEQVVIVSETIFSMDGDVADLERLIALKKKFDSVLYLDEAHAVGVCGARGLGKAEESGVLADVDLLVGTFGKAFASIGAFVCCSDEVYSYLVNRSRSFIFTTALPPVTLHWNRFVFALMTKMTEERTHLQTLSKQLRQDLTLHNIPTSGSTNIIPVLIGDDTLAVTHAETMQSEGYLIFAVRPPAVPEGTARFRLSLCADMSYENISRLAAVLQQTTHGQHIEK